MTLDRPWDDVPIHRKRPWDDVPIHRKRPWDDVDASVKPRTLRPPPEGHNIGGGVKAHAVVG